MWGLPCRLADNNKSCKEISNLHTYKNLWAKGCWQSCSWFPCSDNATDQSYPGIFTLSYSQAVEMYLCAPSMYLTVMYCTHIGFYQSCIQCPTSPMSNKPLTHMAYFSKAAFPAALLTPTKAMCSQKQCALKHHSLHRLFVIILSSFFWQECLPCCHHC